MRLNRGTRLEGASDARAKPPETHPFAPGTLDATPQTGAMATDFNPPSELDFETSSAADFSARIQHHFESQMAPTGTTTVPKALRESLGAAHGGRLVWQPQADGTILVSLKHVYPARLVPTGSDAAARIVGSSDAAANAAVVAGPIETHENPPLLCDRATHPSSA